MATIQFTIDDSIETDALSEIKLRTNNESITINDYLTDILKSYAKRNRIRKVNINDIIDQTGL